MRQIAQYLIFLFLLLTLSLIMHVYIFFHLAFMFGIPRDIWFWIFLIAATLSFLAGMAIRFATESTGKASIALFVSSSTWFGVMFFFLFSLMMYDILRLFLSVDIEPLQAGRSLVVVLTIVSIYAVINARIIFTKEITIPAHHINSGLRIVHLSDIHIGSVHGPGYLEKIVAKTNKLKPDVVLLTGDLADGGYNYRDETFASLNNIKAPVYFSVGNHEHYAGLDRILDILSRTKVKVLRNEKTVFKGVEIIGIDYDWGRKTFADTLSSLSADPDKYTILMFHNPMGLKEAEKHNIDLMLSGHTHGGQFFPMMIPGRMIWKYNRGLHRYKNSYIFTSTGVGTFGPPMRLGTNNQIVLIKLVGATN